MYEPLAPLPTFNALAKSPELVSVLDKVRFGPLSDDYEYGEFLWFIRECIVIIMTTRDTGYLRSIKPTKIITQALRR